MYRLKYLAVYIVPLSAFYAFGATGIYSFMPMFILFGLLPLIELFLPVDRANFEAKVASDEKNARIYDWILYSTIPLQIITLIYFLFVIQDTPFLSLEYWTRIIAMGLMCGIVGINVGHELGHRLNRLDQFFGEILLLTSLNTHFLPYHNAGHHLNVATPSDPATAAKNQWLYGFWFRSHFKSYFQAWRLESRRLKQKGERILSLSNRMVTYSFANLLLLGSIFYFFDWMVLVAFICSAVVGIGLLQTINYIEHYGLLRKLNERGKYEAVRHQHSWNSDHPLGRAVLFNLSRHSDHHYNGSTKYQLLRSLENSPQMPTGYPGMLLLAVFQPLWFRLMNKRIDEMNRID